MCQLHLGKTVDQQRRQRPSRSMVVQPAVYLQRTPQNNPRSPQVVAQILTTLAHSSSVMEDLVTAVERDKLSEIVRYVGHSLLELAAGRTVM